MRKIRLYSDLHQEHKSDQFKIEKIENEQDQILILAGDIAHLKSIMKGQYDDFFRDLNERFYAIFYVMGSQQLRVLI